MHKTHITINLPPAILTLLFVIILVGCSGNQAESQSIIAAWEPTPNSKRTLHPTPSRMPTQTAVPLPTLQATATPINSAIPTPFPTQVPSGVYIRQSDGFRINYPSVWEISDENESRIQFYDDALEMSVSVFSDFVDEDSYEMVVAEFQDTTIESTGFENAEIVAEETMPFGDQTAQLAWLNAQNANGHPLGIFIAYVDDGLRNLIIVAFGQPDNLAARETTLKTMMAQAQLGGTNLFGLPQDETLVLLSGDPLSRSFDPARTRGSAAGFVGLLYSGLVRLTPDLQVIPDLAESWAVSDDGTVYTFVLRDGLMFASGRPLTSADILYSWERAADPETESTTAITYLSDIVGVTEKLNGEADSIAGLEIIDERTIQVTLDGPKAYFLAKLTYPTSYIVDQDAVGSIENDSWVYKPNPSGPYDLAEYEENELLVFERNINYHSPPAITNVVYQLARVGNRLSLFEAGEVDIVYLGSTDSQEVAQTSHSMHEQWISTTSLCTTLVQMNNEIAPMDDPLVRQAFALAVDKDGLNELISEGTSLVAESILPPAMPGYSQTLVQERAAMRFDEEAARTALAASTYAEGLPPVIISAGGFGDSERDDLNALIETWQDVLGADVSIEFLDPNNFTEVVKDEHGQMVSYGWCADYVDPENFLDLLYHSESSVNVAGYHNPEVDALLEEARVELDVSRRLALYQQIEQMLLNDSAAIPLAHGVSDALVNDRVQGFVLSPMGAPIVPLLSLETAVSGE